MEVPVTVVPLLDESVAGSVYCTPQKSNVLANPIEHMAQLVYLKLTGRMYSRASSGIKDEMILCCIGRLTEASNYSNPFSTSQLQFVHLTRRP